MSRHEVKCINKSHKASAYGNIQSIGGINSDGSRWRITQERAIDAIESGKWEFYVNSNGRKVDVVVKNYNGKKILKTENDGFESNNLSNLPECP
ncbi:DUF3892 domain-containing protein [Bizionia sp. M204]|uniref:DUF3892 domain-containing protein n=1 Tax=Bizionia sp. M204 TaxID=2675331 RepID=UPI002049150A|nr:DUF3892 domain-containing protein [Bizionia sp. M204]UPS92824.1 DUF3892 domain-containing protein [Bizionia sp. M204]